jgi:glycerol-3-phosphate acyltransferase PlsY
MAMTNVLLIAGSALGAYLLGAIPNGFIVARCRGVDIRTVGSGNIGATNVFRSVSKTLGLLTFFLDALKGFVPAYFFPLAILRLAPGAALEYHLRLLCASAAVSGHVWPVYLGFKGGKGIATGAGALVGVAPITTAIGLPLWLLVFAVTRYVSVASIAAAASVAVNGWIFYRDHGTATPVTLSLLSAIAIWRHRNNVHRLLHGTEHRFVWSRRRRTVADRSG